MNEASKSLAWFERPNLTISEAASVLCRSQTWVRGKIVLGVFEPLAESKTPIRITTSSILSFIERTASGRAQPAPSVSGKGAARLKLVVDNTSK